MNNVIFLPMTNNKVTFNSVIDQHIPSNTFTVNTPDGDIFPQINFVQDLEFYGATKFIDTINDLDSERVMRNFPSGIEIKNPNKWINNHEVYQCADSAVYGLTVPPDCTVKNDTHYVFVSPSQNKTNNEYEDLSTIPIADNGSKEVTIKFFVKFLGFTHLNAGKQTIYNGITTEEVDFFRYGSNMRISLLRVNETKIDLHLRNASHQLVAVYQNFLIHIGKWIPITLSYSSFWDPANTEIWDRYPDKLNFQVGNKQVTIIPGTFDKLTVANFLTLTIPKEVIALWTRGMISYNYFNGFMGIYTSKDNPTLLFDQLKRSTTADKLDIFKGTNIGNCLDTNNYFNMNDVNGIIFHCVIDYDFQIVEETNYNCNYAAMDESSCLQKNSNCPLGYIQTGGDICSCSNKDKKLMLIDGNNGINRCKSKHC